MLRLVGVFSVAAAVVVATSPPAVAVAAVSAAMAAAWRRRMVGRPLVAACLVAPEVALRTRQRTRLCLRYRTGLRDRTGTLQGGEEQAVVAELVPEIALRDRGV